MIPQPLRHQVQPSAMSCVCTCIAMIVGEDAKSIVDKYHDAYYNGKYHTAGDILEELGFSCTRYYSDSLNHTEPGYVYLLSVPSLNIPGAFHQVVLDYRVSTSPVIYDPAKGYSDAKKYYTLSSVEADEEENAFLIYSWLVSLRIEQ